MLRRCYSSCYLTLLLIYSSLLRLLSVLAALLGLFLSLMHLVSFFPLVDRLLLFFVLSIYSLQSFCTCYILFKQQVSMSYSLLLLLLHLQRAINNYAVVSLLHFSNSYHIPSLLCVRLCRNTNKARV